VKFLIILNGILYFAHKGLVDFKQYSDDAGEEEIRARYSFLLNDFTYLVMTVVLFWTTSYVAHISELPTGDFLICLSIGMLLGSELWDLLFSKLLHNDWMYVIPNWAFGWGFKTKTQRIVFDTARVGSAILLTTLFI